LTPTDLATFSENEFMLRNPYPIYQNGQPISIKISENMKDGKYITSAGEYNPIDLLKQIKEAPLMELVNTNIGHITIKDFEEMESEGYYIQNEDNPGQVQENYIPSGSLVSKMMESEDTVFPEMDFTPEV